jgi:hypothetical protein
MNGFWVSNVPVALLLRAAKFGFGFRSFLFFLQRTVRQSGLQTNGHAGTFAPAAHAIISTCMHPPFLCLHACIRPSYVCMRASAITVYACVHLYRVCIPSQVFPVKHRINFREKNFILRSNFRNVICWFNPCGISKGSENDASSPIYTR